MTSYCKWPIKAKQGEDQTGGKADLLVVTTSPSIEKPRVMESTNGYEMHSGRDHHVCKVPEGCLD